MILHVVKSNIYSGAENVVCQIITGLSEREEFIYMAPHGPIEDKLKSMGLYDHYYGIDSLDASSIQAAVDKFHPSVVHAHDFTASVLCALALKNRVPIISHLHNNPPWIKKFHIKTISYLMACKYIDHILMVSDAVRDEYRYTNRLKCPYTIVGNPFSVEGVKSQVSSDNSTKLRSDLLFVGRLTEQKDPMTVVKVAKALLDKQIISCARLVGDGELKDELQTYITDNGLDSQVILEGFTKNAYDYMASTRVLMMPSKWEGFGLVALEGMALGIPVVGSDAGGLKHIIDDTCGKVCASPDDYVDSITELLSRPDIYESKSAGASARALEYNNINEYCNRLYDIYQSLTLR